MHCRVCVGQASGSGPGPSSLFPVVYSNRSAGLQAGSLYTCESPLSGIYPVSRSAGRSVSQSVGWQVVRSSNQSVGRAAQQSIGKAVALIDRSAGRSAGLPLLRARSLGLLYEFQLVLGQSAVGRPGGRGSHRSVSVASPKTLQQQGAWPPGRLAIHSATPP